MYKLDDFTEIDLDAREEVDETQMDTHLTITERYLVEWNTSRYICCWNKKRVSKYIRRTYIYLLRQIGGWVDTQYVSPESYWIKIYKINQNRTIQLTRTLNLPEVIHGELERISVFEHDKVYNHLVGFFNPVRALGMSTKT